MNNIVASFSNDTAFNDYYVHSFVCRTLKKCMWKQENEKMHISFYYSTKTHTHTHTKLKHYEVSSVKIRVQFGAFHIVR